MKLIGKGSKLYSIFRNRCPRCHNGLFWERSNPYSSVFFGKGRMNESCSYCGMKYEREVGFWYGAMYVSYAIGVALFVTGWVATTVLLPAEWNVWIQIGIVSTLILALYPVNFWLSRLVWISLFVKYDPEKRGTKY